MDPNFLAIYSRSKYLGLRRALSTDKTAMRHFERFAVAATAFTLQHDEGFKKHFLKAVCGYDKAVIKDFEIQIEPKLWGDLVIENKKAKVVFVAEFKIGSKLSAHQNPNSKLFYRARSKRRKGGYGWRILNEFKEYRLRRFIVIQNHGDFDPCGTDVCCISRNWRCLLKRYEAPLETDLFDCLERIGVDLAKLKDTKMKTTTKTADSAKIISILKNVLKDQDLKPSGDHYEIDSEQRRKEDWYFGLNVPKRSNRRLNSLLQSGGKHAVWIGYQGSKGHSADRAIWLYLGKNAKIREKLNELKKLKDTAYGEPSALAVEIKSAAVDLGADEKWFREVMKRLLA